MDEKQAILIVNPSQYTISDNERGIPASSLKKETDFSNPYTDINALNQQMADEI